MAVLSKAEIAALSTQDRLALIGDLWESLEAPRLDASIDAAHRRIVEERLAEYDPSREEFLTLDGVCDRLRARSRGARSSFERPRNPTFPKHTSGTGQSIPNLRSVCL